ncbi:SusC/RagA family TonB-linked outer membrane protein [Chitinophaga defluvii]|uniref:TonB-dependent receptor n=1 Tax=Chitinophaga defluvii TaxID=3163343 RepID=A0ABV2T3Y8_9BACT
MKKKLTFLMRAGVQTTWLLLMCLLAVSQSRKITGKVTDANDKTALPGVTVQVKGSSTGTQTKPDGTYAIEVPQNAATLTFSFVGYTTQEREIGYGLVVNVTMSADVKSLQDVVVIGYGTQKRSDVTGAVASIRGAALKEREAPSVNQALAGRIPGVSVSVNSGRPGGQTAVRIRGFSSINTTNNPLYVLDGVALPMGTQANNSNAIDFINPSDIASVEVLKDASATAIYGARGANGVILITSKRGIPGPPRLTYDVSVSTNTIGPHRVKMLDAKEFVKVEDLTYENIKVYDPVGWANGDYAKKVVPKVKRAGIPELFDSNGDPLYNTDWLKESVQHKISQNHQLGFSGGNGDNTYGIYVGYRDDEGLLLNSYLKRYSARFNFDSKMKEWLTVGGSLTYNSQEENIVDQGTGGLNSVRMITEAFPFLPVKMPNGVWGDNQLYPGAEGGSNPVHILTDRKLIMNTQTALGSLYSNITFAKGLEMKTVLGVDVVTRGINEYAARELYGISNGQKGIANALNGRESYWSLENYLTYNKRINQVHAINALLGIAWQESNFYGFGAHSENFNTDYYQTNNLGAGSSAISVNSSRDRSAFNSYFGRVNYSFKDKYMLTATGRIDGSSKFGANHKYAFFPSAGLAWRASEEPFLKGNTLVSNLKLRTSYGVTGNSEIPSYAPLQTLSAGNSNGNDYRAIIGGQQVTGTGLFRLDNPDLKWERTAQFDGGIELGLLKNRISLEVDYYYRKTTDMLLDAPVPRTSGYATIRKNIGSMENKGLEIGLSTVNIESANFSWTSAFNISLNKNKVLSLATPADIFGVGNPNFTNQTGIIRIGEPVGSFWGLDRLGTWSEAERAEAAKFVSYRGGKPILPGDIKYRDVNGDYAINDADRMIIGNGNPKGWGAFINTFKYKNLELTVDLQYSYGADVLNMQHHSGEDRQGQANSFASVLNAWTPTNQNTPIAAIRDQNAGYVTNVDTRWVEDGSFIRGRNLLLGYNFKEEKIKSIHLNKLRIYASVQNFFLITNYSGNDPEVTTYGNAFAQGQTFFDYPKPTTFTLGLNVGL